jgi:hypothetical protein
MNCSDFEKAVQRRLDGVKEPELPALDAHLAQCPECRTLDEAASRLAQGLALMRASAAAPPIGMRERIVRRALAEQRARSQRRRLAALALAASVAVAVVLSRNWLRSPVRPGASEVVRRETPSLSRSVREAQVALSSIVNRTAGTAIDEGRSLLPVPTSFETPALLARSLDPPVRTIRITGARVGESFNPVLDSAKDAVQFFLGDDHKTLGGQEK